MREPDERQTRDTPWPIDRVSLLDFEVKLNKIKLHSIQFYVNLLSAVEHTAFTLVLFDIITSTSILAQAEDSRSSPQQLQNQECDAIKTC